MNTVKLSNLIAPSFYEVHNDIKEHSHTHYWLKGGRGSTKSSFVSIEIVKGIMEDPEANAVAIRKIGNTIKDSVFNQLVWAIEQLGVSHLWNVPEAKLELTYNPTGQKIKFRGADKPKSIKSIKFTHGYCKYTWYEEIDQFKGPEEIRTINQSLMRGGERFFIFYTYNPPESQRNWVNKEVIETRADKLVHHSTYLTVPRAWLGEMFIAEAEHLKNSKPEKYAHEYMGEVTGTGGEIFTNITARVITKEERKNFDKIRRGVDWGFAVDPFHYGVMHFDSTRKKLYIFYEYRKVGLSNAKAAEHIKKENKLNQLVICDSAEPKSIDDIKQTGIRVVGAKKGPDSIDYGIKFLQDLTEIIIDPDDCPETLKEFLGYEYERDSEGNFKAEYPDKNNHSIDMARYALNNDIMKNKIKISNKSNLGLR